MLFGLITLTSNQTGPITAGNGNRTGSGLIPNASCSGPTCHAPNTPNTSVIITLTDTDNFTPIASYTPGKVYAIRISGSNNSAILPRFGLQISSVRSNNIQGQAGKLSLGGNTDVSLKTLDGLQIIEHHHIIPGSGTGTSWSYATYCFWTAPPAGTGQVKFFTTLNAINANGYASGDQTNNATLTVEDGAASVRNNEQLRPINVYPNPVSDNVYLNGSGINNGEYRIKVYNVAGVQIDSKIVNVVNESINITISASCWNAGVYMLHIINDEQQRIVPIVKQ
jgi:hypothetical protein